MIIRGVDTVVIGAGPAGHAAAVACGDERRMIVVKKSTGRPERKVMLKSEV